jgi:hypothetical protein
MRAGGCEPPCEECVKESESERGVSVLRTRACMMKAERLK